MSDFPQVDLLGELAAHRSRHVLVVAQPAAGQRPRTALRIAGALPQQDAELRLLALGAGSESANLEYDGEHFVCSATMWPCFRL